MTVEKRPWYVPVKGFEPPKTGEHPRLLFRRRDLPALRKKAETAEGNRVVGLLASEVPVVDHCLLNVAQLIWPEFDNAPIHVRAQELLEAPDLKELRAVSAISKGQEILLGPFQVLVIELVDR